VISAFLE